MKLGIAPCGLGARDTLRLEAGLPLYGHEYNDQTSVLEVGYNWAVKFNHEFIGKGALAQEKELGLKRKLIGLKLSDKAIPRQGAKVYSENKEIGIVTSGTFSPTLKLPIALAFITSGFSGNVLDVEIRDNKYPAVVSPKKMV
jgi:aminomethyltransferase